MAAIDQKNFSIDQKNKKCSVDLNCRVLILYYRNGYTDGGGKNVLPTFVYGLEVPGKNLVGAKTDEGKENLTD